MARRTPGRTRSDAVRSLEWTAAIERAVRALPRRRGLGRLRRRQYAVDRRVATAVGFPGSPLFTDPATGRSLLVDPGSAPQVRSTATPDVVVAGAMRTASRLRYRAFYLGAARSLAVQQRHRDTPTPLVGGTRVQRTLAGRTPFVVPRVLDAGYYAAQRADWVVEEALDGAPVVREEAERTAEEVLSLLPEMWQRLGTAPARLDERQRARALTAFTALAEDPPDGIWPGDVDRGATARRVRELLTDERPLTVGLSHGDPGLGNVLRLTDGRLALVDWEDAGHRPVAHDVVKVVMSTPDPVGLAGRLAPPPSAVVGSTAVMPWSRQVAAALGLFLGGWRYRHSRAVKRGSTVASRRRMHAMIRTLDVLLER